MSADRDGLGNPALAQGVAGEVVDSGFQLRCRRAEGLTARRGGPGTGIPEIAVFYKVIAAGGGCLLQLDTIGIGRAAGDQVQRAPEIDHGTGGVGIAQLLPGPAGTQGDGIGIGNVAAAVMEGDPG